VGDVVKVSCEDGRSFIREVVTRLMADPFPAYSGPKKSKNQENQERRKQRSLKTEANSTPALPRNRISHFVMNLPDSAIQFLDAFRGILSEEQDSIYTTMPMIHCHCFTREIEPENARTDILKVGGTNHLCPLYQTTYRGSKRKLDIQSLTISRSI
jgi:tRNA (guanine37-N1)-methyltransferase